MAIRNVFVLGAGLMGGGIAQVCAQSGFEVGLCDLGREALDKAMKAIAWSVGKLVEKGSVAGPAQAVIDRVHPSTSHEPASGADLVIEAVFEDLELKRKLLARLDQVAAPAAILASNTSAISITELAACTRRPDKFLGLHFFSPVPMMQAVELVRGLSTSDETLAAARAFVEAIGKVPILVNKDIPGFLVNRINLPSNLEAMRMVEQGVGSVEDIDRAMCLATGRKMGPFETGDMVGLDVTLGAVTAIYEETKDPRWAPPTILRRKVKAGHLGRKSGRGWYEYGPDGKRKAAG
jgi:3-hydroxybutyryl-CoA dehydrogenase